jgi:UDP-N-acetyl-D-mannosaminuronic acid dehydrogenase
MAEKLGLDVKEIIKLANTHPRVKILEPGCGVGGTCIPKDPVLLSNLSEEFGFKPKLINIARDINNLMPVHFAKRISGSIENGARVLILGIAYKGNVSETRDSPAIVLFEQLRKYFDVCAYDPFVKNMPGMNVVESLDDIEKFDAIVLATDHDEFKKFDEEQFGELLNDGALVADGRRIWDKAWIEGMGYKYIGVGV